MKEHIYVLTQRASGNAYEFRLISRVICALVVHHGRYVRFNHSWHKVHEKADFEARVTKIKNDDGTIFFRGEWNKVSHGVSLPFIDPAGIRSPGLYPEQ